MYTSEYQKKQTSKANSGVKSHLSKLNDEKVREIRCLYKQGYTQKRIGEIYKLKRSTIGYVVTNKTWKHVK
jgi:DNA-directed RNA polymerase specialized sigma subunit